MNLDDIKIDLDDLKVEVPQQKATPEGNVSLVETEAKPVVKSAKELMAEFATRNQRLVYVVDVSGSMEGCLKTQTLGRRLSKLDAWREFATRCIEERFTKFPGAVVDVIQFDHEPVFLTETGKKAEVLSAISRAYGGGGTCITPALKMAMESCGTRGAASHHVVLVTDGEDPFLGAALEGISAQMKERAVILDVIFLGECGGVYEKWLRSACAQTGGEFTTVATLEDFETKFLTASRRLALPPVS